ncbi:SGNH/GDSL hydrolase family protein [Psychroflexus torquis]|nr:SGNH/GDSL hydrolase family protein [Psychroflexus torquis]
MKTFIALFLLITMTSTFAQDSLSYLALGDSYSIGEQVSEEESWPVLLTSFLNQQGYPVEKPEVIAVTGWRTDELQDFIASLHYKKESFDLVSLLIGVNNQYQKKPFKKFKSEFEDLLKTAIELSSQHNKGVFIVGIPDYSLSKFAQDEKLKKVSSRLKRYNRYIEKMSQRYNVVYFPMQQFSKPLHKEKLMLAEDLLHPSGLQYKAWVDSFKDEILSKVKSF